MAVNRLPDPNGGIQPSTLTTTGDILYASSAQVAARLAIGSANQALGVSGGIPAYQASSKSTLTTTGDILYASAANTPARLGIGSSAQVLTVASGIPSWATPASAGGTWAAWTPTFTNLTVGNGTLTSRYATVGKIVFMSLKFVLGSTSSIGSGVSITWPVTPASTEAAQTGQMSVWIQDISSGAFLSTIAAYERTTSIFKLTNVYVSGTQIGADSGFTSTSPFTWATGDLIWFSGSYESV